MAPKFGNAFAQQKEEERLRDLEAAMDPSQSKSNDAPLRPMTTMDMFIDPDVIFPEQGENGDADSSSSSSPQTRKDRKAALTTSTATHVSAMPSPLFSKKPSNARNYKKWFWKGERKLSNEDAEAEAKARRLEKEYNKSQGHWVAKGKNTDQSSTEQPSSQAKHGQYQKGDYYDQSQRSRPEYLPNTNPANAANILGYENAGNQVSVPTSFHVSGHAQMLTSNWPLRNAQPHPHYSTATLQTYATSSSQYGLPVIHRNDGMILSDTATAPTRFGGYARHGTPYFVHPPSMMSLSGHLSMASHLSDNRHSNIRPDKSDLKCQANGPAELPAHELRSAIVVTAPSAVSAPVRTSESVDLVPAVETTPAEQRRRASNVESQYNLEAQGQSRSAEGLGISFDITEIINSRYASQQPRRSASDGDPRYSAYTSAATNERFSEQTASDKSKASRKSADSSMSQLSPAAAPFEPFHARKSTIEELMTAGFSAIHKRFDDLQGQVDAVNERLRGFNIKAEDRAGINAMQSRLSNIDLIPQSVGEVAHDMTGVLPETSYISTQVGQLACVPLPPPAPAPRHALGPSLPNTPAYRAGVHHGPLPPTMQPNLVGMPPHVPTPPGNSAVEDPEVLYRKPSSGEKMVEWFSNLNRE